MDWDITWEHGGVALGAHEAYQDGPWGLEMVDFETEGIQMAILRARENIAKTQAILEASQIKLKEFSKRKEELILQQG